MTPSDDVKVRIVLDCFSSHACFTHTFVDSFGPSILCALVLPYFSLSVLFDLHIWALVLAPTSFCLAHSFLGPFVAFGLFFALFDLHIWALV